MFGIEFTGTSVLGTRGSRTVYELVLLIPEFAGLGALFSYWLKSNSFARLLSIIFFAGYFPADCKLIPKRSAY